MSDDTTTTDNREEIKRLVTEAITGSFAPVIERITNEVTERLKAAQRPEGVSQDVIDLIEKAADAAENAESEVSDLKSQIEDWEYRAGELRDAVDSYSVTGAEDATDEARRALAEAREQLGL